MEIAGQRAFQSAIDNFQEFYNINNSIYMIYKTFGIVTEKRPK